ncbi:MAG: acetolactate synthase small subunit [Proteobacteria bacterium]|nr:acetolactate synthase small subunit [Pseudomonadota bacterium]
MAKTATKSAKKNTKVTAPDKRSKIQERRTLSIIVDNEFGVLGRVIGLFSGRGYNIESLTVSEVDHDTNISRITIVTTGAPAIIDQIKALLERMVPVYTVRDLTTLSPHIEREVGLFKIVSEGKERVSALGIADRFGARVIDSTDHSFIFELSDTPPKLDKFIRLLKPYGLKEICRTGVTAISRGDEYIQLDQPNED